MQAAIYLRKSRAEEIADTTEETLQKHKETLFKYANQNGISITQIYEEVVSGESLYARPQMLKLLEDIEKGKHDAVLVMDIDRLGRGAMSDQGIILETFKRSNTKIITLRKTYDLNNELDEEYTEFETFIARRELKLIKRRMQRGIQKTIEDGGYIANAPFGYDKAYINKKPTLTINDNEAHFVRLAFNMYVNQGAGTQLIADEFNKLGAKPKRGLIFSRNSIRFILKNPVYIGKIVWDKQHHIRKGTKGNDTHITIYNPEDKWTISDGLHPAIIDTDLFNKAQEIRLGKYHPPFWTGTLENPLAGLISCKICGKNMQRRPFKKISYLICTTKGCVKATRFDRIEIALLSSMESKLQELPILKQNNYNENITTIQKTIDILNKEIAVANNQLDKLHDFLEQNVYDIKTYNKRLSALNEKYENLTESKNLLKTKIDKLNNNQQDATILNIKNVLDAYSAATIQKKNELLKNVIDAVVYYKEKDWGPDEFQLDIFVKDFS